MSFLSFSWLIALVTSSSTIFNRNGKSRQPFLASDLKGKKSFIIKNKISCWLFMDGLSQVKFLPTESIYHERMILLLYKNKAVLFSLFSTSLYTPFCDFFPVWWDTRTTTGKRKPRAAVHPLPEVRWAASATRPSCLHSWPVMPLLSGTSCIPPLLSTLLAHCLLALGPLASCHFRVQIPFLSLPRSPRLLWQLLVSGQLKATFQMAKFPFHSCTSMIPQIFYENFLMPVIVLVWYW